MKGVVMDMIRILLVEDQLVLCDSLAKLLNGQEDMQVVAQTGSASEALDLCLQKKPDLVLMDVVTKSQESGISVAAKLRSFYPDLKIIIMTGMPEITFVDKAKKAGVNGFIYKNVKCETLVSAIRSTLEGYRIFPSDPLPGKSTELSFTEEEIAVLKLVCSAQSRKEIAANLYKSESAVKGIITGILDKTGYDSIMKYAIYAISNGYIAPNM